jgi:hypothetical protein
MLDPTSITELKKIMLTSPHLVLEARFWNDLTNTGDSGGNYQPKGYIVEYGGTNDDPVLK